jgi:RNA 2',3'-cyclic 3'-phosphodiesterase
MRTFFALELPSPIVEYLKTVSDKLARRTEGVKWVRSEGIHVTIKFLGEIDEAMVEPMKNLLSPIGARFGPVKVRLGELDAFPRKRSARVIAVTLEQGVGEVQAIFAEVEEGLATLDIEKEKRELVPHITLGRRRVPKPFPDSGDMMPIEKRDFVIDDLVLYQSTLTPGGAVYNPIWKIKLGGKRA